MEKHLFCPKCKIYPEDIIEKYLEPVEEKRKWDKGIYALIDTNMDSMEFEQLCAECRTKLEFK